MLVSNIEASPAKMFDGYFGRTSIDIISTIVYLQLLKSLKEKGMSVTKLLGCTSSLMCMRKKDGMIEVETPNKGTKAAYKNIGIPIHSSFLLNIRLLRLQPMTCGQIQNHLFVAGMCIITITESELWAVIDYPLMLALYYETICN